MRDGATVEMIVNLMNWSSALKSMKQ